MDSEVLRHLREGVKGGFDEEKFRPFIGFNSVKEFLESELQKRYKEAAPATLALLEQRCSEVTYELAKMDTKIQATSDVAHLRRSAMLHTASISSHVVCIYTQIRFQFIRIISLLVNPINRNLLCVYFLITELNFEASNSLLYYYYLDSDSFNNFQSRHRVFQKFIMVNLLIVS